MYYERGELDESLNNFEKIIKLAPRNIDWKYGYVEALIKKRDFEKAIETLNKVEDQVGINLALSIQKYTLLMQAKFPKKAVAELDNAREVYTNDPELIAVYVDHYFKTNEMGKALEMLKELVVADPSNGRAHLALADIYREQKEDDKSFEELILAFQSDDVSLDTKMKILINIHDSSFKIDPEVYILVNLLVESYPTEAKAHSIHGDYLLRAEKNDEALYAYKQALEYDKAKYPIWNQVLIMEYQNRDFENLYKDSKECLTFFSTSTTAALLNGVSANQLKKHNEAVDVLSAGKELVINDKPLEAEFYGELGEAYFGIKDFSNGKKSFNKALSIDRESLIIRNNFAYRLAINREDLDLAESLALQASEGGPLSPQFIDTYGWVLFQKGDYDLALFQFNRAFKLKENDYMIVEHLGDVYFKIGKITEALVFWEKAKELLSDNQSLEKKIEDKRYYDPVY
jgi:tetratricopeptide (TPR) repeat protein